MPVERAESKSLPEPSRAACLFIERRPCVYLTSINAEYARVFIFN
jgi:hypothetical protein